MSMRKLLGLGSVFVSAFVFAAVPGTLLAQDATPEATEADAGEGFAHVRLVHVAPDAGPVDVYVDDILIFEALDFQTYTDFLADFPAADYIVDLRPAGSPIEDEPVFTGEITIEPDIGNTIIANGLFADETFSVYVYPTTEQEIEHIEAGGTEIELVNIAGEGNLDLLLDGEVLLDNVGQSLILFALLEPGDYTVGVAPTGTTDLIIEEAVTMEAGVIYSLIAYLDEAGEIQFLLAGSLWDPSMEAMEEATEEAGS